MTKHTKKVYIIVSLIILVTGVFYYYYLYKKNQSKQVSSFEYDGPVETISQGKIEKITDKQITITDGLGDNKTTYNFSSATLLFKSVKDSNIMEEANISDLKIDSFVGIILSKDYKDGDIIKEIDIFTY